MAVTAQQVSELRRRTNVGMMDCKKALVEADGDMDKAIELLKEWGIAKAAKKGDRGANEGVISIVLDPSYKKGVLVEVNCETDFVSNTSEYKDFAHDIAKNIFDSHIDSAENINDALKEKLAMGISKFGENIMLGSVLNIAGNGVMGQYVHSNFKNGTIVSIEGEGNLNQPDVLEMAKDIAVHISANSVHAVDESGIDPNLLAEKKAAFLEEVKEQGKPEQIAQKIVDGKMSKFLKDETLLEQSFLKNEDISIKELLLQVGKKTSTTLKVSGFVKKVIGE